MTKDTDYDFEYNLPNHLHLIINTLIHSHLMLSESSLSQKERTYKNYNYLKEDQY